MAFCKLWLYLKRDKRKTLERHGLSLCDVLIVNLDQVQDSAHLLNVFITEFQHVFTC